MVRLQKVEFFDYPKILIKKKTHKRGYSFLDDNESDESIKTYVIVLRSNSNH